MDYNQSKFLSALPVGGPGQHVDDINCAIDYLTQQPGGEAGRIGSLGMCAGGS